MSFAAQANRRRREKSVGICAAAIALAFAPLAFANGASPQSLMQAGHWKQVRALAQKMMQEQPNSALSNYWMAEAKQAFGDDAGALPLAEKAVALDRDNAAYHLCLSEIYGDMAEHAGLFKQMSLGRSFKAEADRAEALDPKNLDAHFHLLQFYLEAPGMIGGGKDRAYAEAGAIAQINAGSGFAAQAQIASHEKNDVKELGNLQKHVASDPRRYEAQVALANYYFSDKRKNFALAESSARAAEKIAPDNAAPYVILAVIYATQQRSKDLDALLAEAKQNDPDDLSPFYQAGKTLLTQDQDLPRAERHFRLYLTQEPEAGNPPPAATHWRLGQALSKEGRKSDAVAELQTALQLQPNFPDAKKDLKQLQ